jgi:hypothetical protein
MQKPNIPLQKKVQPQPSAGKVMPSCFWDSERIIFEQCQKMGGLMKDACVTSQNWQFSVNAKDNHTDYIQGSHSEKYIDGHLLGHSTV